jgi:hypothetical protein
MRHVNESYEYEKRNLVGKTHQPFLAKFSYFAATSLSAGNFQRAWMDESGMIKFGDAQ